MDCLCAPALKDTSELLENLQKKNVLVSMMLMHEISNSNFSKENFFLKD